MPAQQYSIKETKEALDLALSCVKAFGDIRADGKTDMNDLQYVVALVPKLQPALDKIELVPKEMGELSAEESEELVGYVAANLAVTGRNAKIYIKYGLKLVHKAYLIAVDVKEMRAELAAPVA